MAFTLKKSLYFILGHFFFILKNLTIPRFAKIPKRFHQFNGGSDALVKWAKWKNTVLQMTTCMFATCKDLNGTQKATGGWMNSSPGVIDWASK